MNTAPVAVASATPARTLKDRLRGALKVLDGWLAPAAPPPTGAPLPIEPAPAKWTTEGGLPFYRDTTFKFREAVVTDGSDGRKHDPILNQYGYPESWITHNPVAP